MSIYAEHPATGVAIVRIGRAGRTLTYRCDAVSHCVTVWDDCDRLAFAFGGKGHGRGLFNTPLDIAPVWPEFLGECVRTAGPNAVWLAVADYGNRRLQMFDLDGAVVAMVEAFDESGGPPCGLVWRPPLLEVEGVEGKRTRIHLASALLCQGRRAHTQPRPPREWLTKRRWVN